MAVAGRTMLPIPGNTTAEWDLESPLAGDASGEGFAT